MESFNPEGARITSRFGDEHSGVTFKWHSDSERSGRLRERQVEVERAVGRLLSGCSGHSGGRDGAVDVVERWEATTALAGHAGAVALHWSLCWPWIRSHTGSVPTQGTSVFLTLLRFCCLRPQPRRSTKHHCQHLISAHAFWVSPHPPEVPRKLDSRHDYSPSIPKDLAGHPRMTGKESKPRFRGIREVQNHHLVNLRYV